MMIMMMMITSDQMMRSAAGAGLAWKTENVKLPMKWAPPYPLGVSECCVLPHTRILASSSASSAMWDMEVIEDEFRALEFSSSHLEALDLGCLFFSFSCLVVSVRHLWPMCMRFPCVSGVRFCFFFISINRVVKRRELLDVAMLRTESVEPWRKDLQGGEKGDFRATRATEKSMPN